MSFDHIKATGSTQEEAIEAAHRVMPPGHRVVEEYGPVRRDDHWVYCIRTVPMKEGQDGELGS